MSSLLRRLYYSKAFWVAASALVFFAFLGFFLLSGMGVLPVATHRERRGKFTITYKTYEFMGHRGTKKELSYHGPLGKRLVVSGVGDFKIDPQDEAAMVYEYCPDSAIADQCGVFYFDGRQNQSLQLSTQRILNYGGGPSWSPGARCLVIGGDLHASVANLQDAKSWPLDELGLKPGPGISRRVYLGKWSPDGHQFSLRVSQYAANCNPCITERQELAVVDCRSGHLQTVAETAGKFRDDDYGWVPGPKGWELRVNGGER